jgi:hypothetical protein
MTDSNCKALNKSTPGFSTFAGIQAREMTFARRIGRQRSSDRCALAMPVLHFSLF